MANPLTRKVMDNILKQSHYYQKENSKLQQPIEHNSNLNKGEVALLTNLISKGNATQIDTNRKDQTSDYLNKPSNLSQNKTIKPLSLKEFTKLYEKNTKKTKENEDMDLASYVTTVSIKSKGK